MTTPPPPNDKKSEPADTQNEPEQSSTSRRPRPTFSIQSFKKRGGLLDGLIAIAFALVYGTILLRTTSDLGYARDEGFYFQAAQAYSKWFEQLLSNWRAATDLKAVDAAWAANNEHPGLIKSLFALSHIFLHKKLHLFSMEGTSFRFPAIGLASAGVALVYFWGAQARGRIAGFIAAALLAAMPRFFYHAHLACFDAPIVTMWMLCAYCYWRALRTTGVLWPVLCGVAFGLALDTKHNAWFLPFAFTAHAVLVEIRNRFLYAGGSSSPEDRPENREPRRAFLALACMAVLGPLVLYALWPWLWRDPIGRFRNYALFHLHHDYYNMEFLGRNYWTPPMPRSYAWVMTAATVPTVTLVLAVAGLCARARASIVPPLVRAARLLLAWLKRSDSPPAHAPSRAADETASTDLLWLLGIAVAYAPWLSSNTPIFGGTKHWMTAYPFAVLFAGAGFVEVVAAARRLLARASKRRASVSRSPRSPLFQMARAPWLPALLGASVLAAPVVETARSHPWGLSSYTPLVGGAAGAATLGLNRTFWGYTTGAVVDYLNREVKKGGVIYIHDTAGQAWDMMVRDGRIRKDIRPSWAVVGADFALYHQELHMQGMEHQNWVAFGTVAPAHVGGLDGVPVILVYKSEKPAAAPR